MRNRVLAFIVVLAAVLLQPVALDAARYGFDPTQPISAGLLVEDATCPGATHALLDVCNQQRKYYLVFNRFKGTKHRHNTYQILQGPIDPTTCAQPRIDVRHIHYLRVPPPPCA